MATAKDSLWLTPETPVLGCVASTATRISTIERSGDSVTFMSFQRRGAAALDDGWWRRVSTSLRGDSIESGFVRSKLTDLACTRPWASDAAKSPMPRILSISQSGGLRVSSGTTPGLVTSALSDPISCGLKCGRLCSGFVDRGGVAEQSEAILKPAHRQRVLV